MARSRYGRNVDWRLIVRREAEAARSTLAVAASGCSSSGSRKILYSRQKCQSGGICTNVGIELLLRQAI